PAKHGEGVGAGCGCQAWAVVGDAAATDPACALSPKHADLRALADEAASQPPPDFVYRRMTPHDSKAGLVTTTSCAIVDSDTTVPASGGALQAARSALQMTRFSSSSSDRAK